MRILAISHPITNALDESGALCRRLLETYPEQDWRFVTHTSCTAEDVAWAEIISGHPNPLWLKQAKNLRWLHVHSAGVNGYERREVYARPDVLVTRAAGVHAVAMAEHAIAMALSLSRRLPELYVRQQAHNWKRLDAQYELSGSTALLLGTGQLAQGLIPLLRGFGCRILGVRRDPGKPVPSGIHEMYAVSELHKVLTRADYLFNTLPYTEATRHLLDEAAFRAAAPRLILINMGRGGTVDHAALYRALTEGRIAAAGLDVTEPEPLPADSPLWDLPNVILTPHCSSRSENTDRRMADLFERQLRHYLHGEPMEGVVDFEAGY